jgi:hypothetical protein
MSTEQVDVFKAIRDDIKAKVSIPIEENSIPTDSSSMRIRLNNPDEVYQFLNSRAKQMTGEINVQLSHKLGSSQFTMLNLAKTFKQNFNRLTTWTAGGFRVNVDYIRTSSIYQTDDNENINIIIGFICYCE